jgi:hypothetical protein
VSVLHYGNLPRQVQSETQSSSRTAGGRRNDHGETATGQGQVLVTGEARAAVREPAKLCGPGNEAHPALT